MFIKQNDLLYEQIFHSRQLTNKLKEMINQLPKDEDITIIRIGDKLSDELKIDEEYKDRIISNIKICIKPEFEILHIIKSDMLSKYNKVKNKTKPSEYVTSILKDYIKSYEYNYDYFNSLNNEEIIDLIKRYRENRYGAHKKDEKSLVYLLKK